MLMSTFLRDVAGSLASKATALKAYGDTPEERLTALRAGLLLEEVGELLAALSQGDAVEVADACADIEYINIGNALTWGIPLTEVFAEVHVHNMAKFSFCHCLSGDGPESCPECAGTGLIRLVDAYGKVIKPPGWQPPDIAEVLKQYGRKQ